VPAVVIDALTSTHTSSSTGGGHDAVPCRAAVVATWFHTVSALTGLVPLLTGVSEVAWPDAANGVYLTLIVVLSAIAQVFLSRAFALASAATVGIANFTQVMWSYAFGVLVLHEHPTPAGVLGAGTILVGASVAACAQSARRSPAAAQGEGHAAAEGAMAASAGQLGPEGEEALLLSPQPSSTDAVVDVELAVVAGERSEAKMGRPASSQSLSSS